MNPRAPQALNVEGLSVAYGSSMALRNVSTEVGEGEWVGLIGPNGAGKTTLLRAVVGLVPLQSGRILIGDAPTTQLTRRQLARRIAYVPQKPELPPDLTASEYVLLGRSCHIGYFGMEKAHDHKVCAEVLADLDLDHMARRRLGTMSGGELQRLVLARALAQEAPILVMDEPTSALDLGRRVDALEIIDRLRGERGLTVVSALHDLTLAGQFADRLLMLAAGELVESGPASSVLDEVTLTRHFGLHVQVLRGADDELVVAPRRA